MREKKSYLSTSLFLCLLGLILSSYKLPDGVVSIFDRPYIQVTPPGISSQTAYCLLRDKYGFIWASTRNGIDRYDGVNYRHYTLGSNQMRTMHSGMSITIYCDEQGDIWAFTERSDIYRFDPIADTFVEILYMPDYQIWGSVQALYCRGDLLIIGATDGITCFDIPTSTVTKRLCPDEDIHSFYSYRDNELFFGASRGIGILDLKDLRGTLQQWVKTDIKTFYYDKNHQKLWVGSNGNGLFVLDPSHPKKVQQLKKTEGLIITDIKPYNDHEMLLAIDGLGVSAFPIGEEIENVEIQLFASASGNAPFELRTSGARSLLIDQERIWLAAYMGGVTCFQPGSNLTVLNVLDQKTVSDNFAFSVDVAPDGRYWVAFNQAIGSFAPDGSDPQMYLKREASYLCVRAARDGTIWCGGFNTGTYHFDPRTGAQEFFSSVVDQPVHDCVYDIYEDKQGDIWLGGLNFELTRLHQRPDKTYDKLHFPIVLVNSISQLNDETIIACTTDGFHLVNTRTGETKQYLDDEEKWAGTNFIYDSRTRNGNEIWLATAGAGLVCYDLNNDSISAYGLDYGLPSLELRGMSMVNDSILYVSTEENGLFAFDCVRRCYLRCLMTSDGLPMNEFLQNSSTLSPDGNLLFGGNNGAVVLSESDMQSHISEFSIFVDTKGLVGDVIKRGREESHSVDLQLTTNDIYHQKEYLFFYRIKGIEDEWTLVDDSRHIKFTHLPPGLYDLEVRAVGAANQYNERTIAIEIEASSFWAAHIISISYILLALSLICLFFTLRLYWINKKHAKK